MPEFPGITHVALTVTDLGRSRAWYQNLFGSSPVIDEDTGPYHHVVWLIGGQTTWWVSIISPIRTDLIPSTNAVRAWTILRSRA